MITEIIVTLISSITTIIGVILVNKRENDKKRHEQDKWSEHIDDEIRTIKKKLDTHNHYAEKFGDIEKAIVGISKDIEYLRERS